MEPSQSPASIGVERKKSHGGFGYVYLVLPTITMLAAGTLAIVDLSPLPTRFPYWFMPFWVGLLCVPGYVLAWMTIRRQRVLSPGRWWWCFGSVGISAICGFAGAIFSAFTIVLGLLSFICGSLNVSLLRLLWRLRPQ